MVTIRRVHSPQNITVDYIHGPSKRESIEYANFDEKYLVFVICSISVNPNKSYEIQVRSTSNYLLVKSKKFTVESEYPEVVYGQGFIAEVFENNSLKYLSYKMY